MNKLFRYPVMFLDIVSPRRCLLCSCLLTHPLAHKNYKHKVLVPYRTFSCFLTRKCSNKSTYLRADKAHLGCGHIPALEDYLCPLCREKLNFCSTDLIGAGKIDKIFSGYQYGGAPAQIIPAWKYHDRSEFFPLIAVLVQQMISRFKFSGSDFDLVTAIPLTRFSLRKRGFNQALFIASCCADLLNLPLLKHQFTKVVDTPHQASLDRDARVRNLNQDVFRVTCATQLANRKILVCDDVMTTGSTLKAAAGALKSAGAVSVTAMTLARVE